jgi:tetratricopeptide (TPR) repeat protein
MNRRSTTLSILSLIMLAAAAPAQSVRVADSLLRRGNLDRAEAEYYAAARARPRDPEARFALGRYLASRGALRIGATLIDEAMQFGFDRRIGATALVRIYTDLGEYVSAASLTGTSLSASERAQLQWLATHPARVVSPDSTVLVAFTRTSLDGYVGAARIRLNGRPMLAMIAPRGGCGIRVSDTSAVAKSLHRFPVDSGTRVPAVADSLGLGRLGVTSVPVSIEPLPQGVEAVACFGALLRYAPTFDPRGGLMTLRLGGKAPPPPMSASGMPMRDIDGQYAVLQGGGWGAVVLPQITSMLASKRWTLDARRGSIFVEP